MDKAEWWSSPIVPAGVGGVILLTLGFALCGGKKAEVPPVPPAAVARAEPAAALPPDDLPTVEAPSRPRAPAGDLSFRTKADYVGARTEAQLDKAARLVADGDREAFASYVTGNPDVFLLKEGVEVFVVDSTGVLGSHVKVRKKGTTLEFWTVREALAH